VSKPVELITEGSHSLLPTVDGGIHLLHLPELAEQAFLPPFIDHQVVVFLDIRILAIVRESNDLPSFLNLSFRDLARSTLDSFESILGLLEF